VARCFADGCDVVGEEVLELRGRATPFAIMARRVEFLDQGGELVREVQALVLPAGRP